MTEKEYKIANALLIDIETYDCPQLYSPEQKKVVREALKEAISKCESREDISSITRHLKC